MMSVVVPTCAPAARAPSAASATASGQRRCGRCSAIMATTRSARWSQRAGRGLTLSSAFRRGIDVFGQEPRCVRDTLVAGSARNVHDVRPAAALDDVDAVQLQTKGLPAAPRKVRVLRADVEAFAELVGVGQPWKDLLDAEQFGADRVDL